MPYSSMLCHANLDSLAVWLHIQKISLGVFSVILWILPPVFTVSFLHPDPPQSPEGPDLLKSFLKPILAPSTTVLWFNMVLLYLTVLLLPTLYDHMFMYVGLFVHSADVFHDFTLFSCFYVLCRPIDVRLCFTSDTVLFIHWLYCIDLFSCIAASVFNKLTYFFRTQLGSNTLTDDRYYCSWTPSLVNLRCKS